VSDNSTVNGYLQPAPPGPLEGNDLLDFIQGWIVGVSALSPSLVRPAYQGEPSNPPDAGNAWAAFWLATTNSDSFPYVDHDPTGDGSDVMQVQERVALNVSFYDLGTSGMADGLARAFRDGANLEQNAYLLRPGGFSLIAVGDLTIAPSLLKVRWLYRVDVAVQLTRQIIRTFPVFTITSMKGELDNDVGLPPRDVSVPHP